MLILPCISTETSLETPFNKPFVFFWGGQFALNIRACMGFTGLVRVPVKGYNTDHEVYFKDSHCIAGKIPRGRIIKL